MAKVTDIDEIRRNKAALGEVIQTAVNAFEKVTGTRVKSITVYNQMLDETIVTVEVPI